FGEVRAKDKDRLQALYDERYNRFKHRMRLEIRTATLQELQENQLGLIQRRVLATSTEILGEPILLSVGFSEYQVLED
ncbi:MAG: dihydrolipoamide acetyltransferase, partial [Pirellula sp.]